MKRTTFLLLAALVFLVVPGCDSNDSDDNGGSVQPGAYIATITGTVNANISGVAACGQNPGGWGVALGPGDSQNMTFLALGQQRPEPGTYPIVTSGQPGGGAEVQFVASVVAEPGVTSYNATSGTIIILSSTAARVSGSFSFEARRGTVGNPSIVNVEGTFNATDFSQQSTF